MKFGVGGSPNPFIHWRADIPAVENLSKCGSNHMRRDRFNSWQIKKEKTVFHEERVALVALDSFGSKPLFALSLP